MPVKARRPKLKTTVPDELFEELAFNLGDGVYRDAYAVQRFCNLFNIHPSAVIAKLIERCPFFQR